MLIKDAKSIIIHHEFYRINHTSSQDKKKEHQKLIFSFKLMLSTHTKATKSPSLIEKDSSTIKQLHKVEIIKIQNQIK